MANQAKVHEVGWGLEYSTSGLMTSQIQLDVRYALSGTGGGGSSTFAALTDVSGTWASGNLVGYDGTKYVPAATGAAVVATSGQIMTVSLIASYIASGVGNYAVSGLGTSAYKHLEVIVLGRQARTAAQGINLYFNGDETAANYRSVQNRTIETSQTNTGGDNNWASTLTGNGSTAGYASQIRYFVSNIDNSTYHKIQQNTHILRDTATASWATLGGTSWENTAPITYAAMAADLSVGGGWASGTLIQFWGHKEQWVVTSVAGGGGGGTGDITGTGTSGQLAIFDAAKNLTDSKLSQDATGVRVSGILKVTDTTTGFTGTISSEDLTSDVALKMLSDYPGYILTDSMIGPVIPSYGLTNSDPVLEYTAALAGNAGFRVWNNASKMFDFTNTGGANPVVTLDGSSITRWEIADTGGTDYLLTVNGKFKATTDVSGITGLFSTATIRGEDTDVRYALSGTAGGPGASVAELHRQYLPSGETLTVPARCQILVHGYYEEDAGSNLVISPSGSLVVLESEPNTLAGQYDVTGTFTSGTYPAWNGTNFVPTALVAVVPGDSDQIILPVQLFGR